MPFDFNKEGKIKMTMEGFVQDLIEGFGDMGTASARPNLFNTPAESDSSLPDD